MKFANIIDKINNISFVQEKTKTTYKYNKERNELVIVSKDGYVITYYHPQKGIEYFNKIKESDRKNGRERH